MHATNHNLETCAAGRCCQPVIRDVLHQDRACGTWVNIGYCLEHADRVIAARARS